ncbi:class I SAM-dependent DNA methyltransferase [Labrenzia sp. 5N]|uniref:class I SAM-dependent DNA methyltransferase n=1 Tax=Labrenzia sp. 5N TaxID=2723402 RepID=UPI00144598DC|nr:class I SAM-dependent DNA methyltransferase [Labrenzia sp. 5N]NKX63293.1 class I SAM-dependent DNA methyltransferase [Labrenzia sp. 5N]
MNAVEIEEAISALAEQSFDAQEFPFAFLEAFGNKATTIKRLRSGSSNKSDLGGVLQTSNIHIKVCDPGEVTQTLTELKESPATKKAKAKFVLATDGEQLEAEDLASGETVACSYESFPDHFGFFLPLAGISTVKQIRESSFDIKATGRLNRLYVELLKDNPEWGTAARRHDMNHFMARLIFCFFAEDTDIFHGEDLFTATIEQMSANDSSNTHEVIGELFRAMNTKTEDKGTAKLPRWANGFPYVNGGLFSGSTEVPRFSRIARSYLLHIGKLDWQQINPDIFGSMIQAVADDEERGALGMHYTSVPNILKVLNPLFLDDLRQKLEDAGNSPQKLLNLRKRMARIRVFDPACGSGNFLVIAYKQMREIEAEINRRRDERDRPTDIPLTNFRGIELRDFPAEIARLALIIAEYQSDVHYRGQKEALADFLPLDAMNWITCGNALRLDWLSICPPTGTGVKHHADDLFHSPLDQAQIDFENEGGETYICGNPPYLGSREQQKEQKEDLKRIFEGRSSSWKTLDYVAGWFMKAADYGLQTESAAAFVSTNSICQGQLVPILWPLIFDTGHEIAFAHTSFKWANLAAHNAGVTVAIVGISNHSRPIKKLFSLSDDGRTIVKAVPNINAYLVPAADFIVRKNSKPLSELNSMNYGNYPGDGNHLTLNGLEKRELIDRRPDLSGLVRPVYGAQEFIKGLSRFCLWIDDDQLDLALSEPIIAHRIEAVRDTRDSSRDKSLNKLAIRPHQYRDRNTAQSHLILVPTVSSEQREFIPTEIKSSVAVTTNQAFALYDAPLWNMALIASRIHLIWIATVCGKMKTDFRYSNTMGWNTFPVPKLTEKNKEDLTRCAEDILLAREAHFPATIADLYDPNNMPADLRAAHERNDETLERIYIGRRFKNDTERLEKLFELYTKMTTTPKAKGAA